MGTKDLCKQTDLSHNLILLSEEASEVIQVVAKILRFGEFSEYEGQTNQERLFKEINDFIAIVQLLEETYGPISNEVLIQEKKDKVSMYKDFSKWEGLLEI